MDSGREAILAADDPLYLAAPESFKRIVLLGAMAAAVVEGLLFLVLRHLGTLSPPAGHHAAVIAYVLLGTVMTLQAMGVIGVAWVLVALSRTTLRADITGVSLEHPWRQWHGQWNDVTRAWHHRGWLTLEISGSFRRWYVRAGAADAATLDRIERALPDAWLDAAAARRHVLRTTLPFLLGAAGLAAVTLLWALRYLQGLR